MAIGLGYSRRLISLMLSHSGYIIVAHLIYDNIIMYGQVVSYLPRLAE